MVTSYPGFAFGWLAGSDGPPARARKPYGLVAFAHTDVQGLPYMDAAFTQGRRAANDVLDLQAGR